MQRPSNKVRKAFSEAGSECTQLGLANAPRCLIVLVKQRVTRLVYPDLFCFVFKVFIFIYFSLFMRDTERERERDRDRQREKQAPCREPDVGLHLGSPGSHPGLQAVLNRCTTGAAHFCDL